MLGGGVASSASEADCIDAICTGGESRGFSVEVQRMPLVS
jgi:hypothetical protein